MRRGGIEILLGGENRSIERSNGGEVMSTIGIGVVVVMKFQRRRRWIFIDWLEVEV